MAKDTDVRKDFTAAVNMTAKQLEKFLKTDESTSVGQKKKGGESTVTKSGRKIVEILGKKKSELSDADAEQMKRTVSYVKRHLKQRPKGDVEDTRWRYSLMNWGHDPLKK